MSYLVSSEVLDTCMCGIRVVSFTAERECVRWGGDVTLLLQCGGSVARCASGVEGLLGTLELSGWDCFCCVLVDE